MSYNFNFDNTSESDEEQFENSSDTLVEDEKFYFGNHSEELYDFAETEGKVDVSLDDINDLNIVINDGDCSNSFFESICQQLDYDGLKYTFSRQNDNLLLDDAVVITLDQQLVSGPRSSVFCAYDNNRDDNSDALALSIDAALNAAGVDSDGIFCGRRGYRQIQHSISTRIPTSTEEAIPESSSTSFVTVSFGTDTPSPEAIATILENGLARFLTYTKDNKGIDLICRAEQGQQAEDFAEYFNTSVFDVQTANNVNGTIPADEAVINPEGYYLPIFNKNTSVSVDMTSVAKQTK